MSWYVAKLVYRIVCGKGDHKAQFDEQLRLIEAHSKREAMEKADAIGRSEQVSFMNHQQQLVQWKYVNVSELYCLHEVVDGTELYSRIEEKEDAHLYEDIVHTKANHLLDEVNTPLLQPI